MSRAGQVSLFTSTQSHTEDPDQSKVGRKLQFSGNVFARESSNHCCAKLRARALP
jgi:hypothetical protein